MLVKGVHGHWIHGQYGIVKRWIRLKWGKMFKYEAIGAIICGFLSHSCYFYTIWSVLCVYNVEYWLLPITVCVNDAYTYIKHMHFFSIFICFQLSQAPYNTNYLFVYIESFLYYMSLCALEAYDNYYYCWPCVFIKEITFSERKQVNTWLSRSTWFII